MTGPHKTHEFIKHTNTHAHGFLSFFLTGSRCFQFSRWPHLRIHTQRYRSPLLSISVSGQRAMALMAEHWTLRQGAGVIFQNNTKKGQRKREGDRKTSKGALESHLLHVLECLTLSFFAFYSYVTHALSPPTPTAWHATLITNVFQAFISSSWEKLHLFSSLSQDDRENKEERTNWK